MNRNFDKKAVFIYFAATIGLVVLQVIMVMVAPEFVFEPGSNNEVVTIRFQSIMNLTFYSFLVLTLIGLFIPFWKGVLRQFRRHKRDYIKFIFAGVLLIFLTSFVVNSIYLGLGITETSDNQEALEELLEGAMFDKVALVLFTVLGAPLVEEMVFRMGGFGILLRMNKKMPPWALILITSFAFGALHIIATFDWIQIFSYMGLGVVLGYFYYKSKNILVPTVIHLLYNLIGVILMFTLYA